MAIKQVTGDPAIDAVIAARNKAAGKDYFTMGPKREKYTYFPTGCVALDAGIGLGGIATGIIIEIFGGESSGKTSLSLQIMREYMKARESIGHDGRWIAIVDLERTISTDLILGMGLDPDRILFAYPDTAEEALQSMKDLVATGRVGLILLDSVDAAQSEAQLKKQVGEVHMGGIAKIMSETLRNFTKLCDETDTTAIFINQVRDNPGVMFGSSETTPGGRALKFYSSLRFKMMKPKPEANVRDAMLMRVKIVKNKLRPPRADEISFAFRYAKGTYPPYDLVMLAKSVGIGRFAGPTFKVDFSSVGGEAGETICTGGGEKLYALLEQDQELFERLTKACFIAAGITPPEETSDDREST